MAQELIHDDCLTWLRNRPTGSIHCCVTDPPYGLKFMGKKWDYDVPSVELWRVLLRVLKPGGTLLSFAGARTQHRMAVNIEDAGFKLCDTLMWLTGQGFPKGADTFKNIQKQAQASAERDVRFVQVGDVSAPVYTCHECGQVLLSCVSEQGSPNDWSSPWDGHEGQQKSSVEGRGLPQARERELSRCEVCTMSHGVVANGAERRLHYGTSPSDGADDGTDANADRGRAPYRSQAREQLAGEPDAVFYERRAQAFRGYKSHAMKPAYEPILICMKLNDGSYANNALVHGVAGLHIDACRVPGERAGPFVGETIAGRYPANILHDGSDEVLEEFPETGPSSDRPRHNTAAAHNKTQSMGKSSGDWTTGGYTDSGSAARFFYCAKASKADRGEGNSHPTVKPLALMRWLVRLVCPPDGIVLDPFMGSGTTGVACRGEGFDFIGIERELESYETAVRRVKN